ncbi:GntR family transcriptional regulator [Defluviimonas denitrificans]|jgi:GntR family transcriptional regulator|uniref:GntR family transcriptional regulator n=1 Tax=Albidovulum denitrificans TaxID=404881 RepID=A0A2S8RWF4_9RHOB|nr:GntR family transcriptional regulator [Defluviimonas denitrificans]PQV52852.1 GntR family transcriptional regulator [Defluviimonas denitrificans]
MEASRADRVTAQLRELIEADFEDGDRLPSEAQLAGNLGVSRSTLREAFSRLWQDGLIEKKWGVGTIVRKPDSRGAENVMVLLPLAHIRSGAALIRESGHKPSGINVSVSRVAADSNLAQLLDVSEGDGVWLVDRVMCADGVPVQRIVDAVPAKIDGCDFDASRFDPLANTLHMMFEAQLPGPVFGSDGRLSAVRAPADTAAVLGIREGDPALLVEHTAYLGSGSIATYAAAWYHPGRVDVRFASERHRLSLPAGSFDHIRSKPLTPAGVSSYLDRLG